MSCDLKTLDKLFRVEATIDHVLTKESVGSFELEKLGIAMELLKEVVKEVASNAS